MQLNTFTFGYKTHTCEQRRDSRIALVRERETGDYITVTHTRTRAHDTVAYTHKHIAHFPSARPTDRRVAKQLRRPAFSFSWLSSLSQSSRILFRILVPHTNPPTTTLHTLCSVLTFSTNKLSTIKAPLYTKAVWSEITHKHNASVAAHCACVMLVAAQMK